MPRPSPIGRRAAPGGRIPILALTGGDPNGVGPEVTLRALAAMHSGAGRPSAVRVPPCRIVLVGDFDSFEFYRSRFRIPVVLERASAGALPGGRGRARPVYVVLEPPSTGRFRVEPGKPRAAAGGRAAASLLYAVGLWRSGAVDGIVTGPLAKSALGAGGSRHPGQTEMIASETGGTPLMLMLNGPLRIGLVTTHLPLRAVARAMTAERLRTAISIFLRSLSVDFGLSRPRLAVLGLNPHAGEGGRIGTEERETISPVIRKLRPRAGAVEGPFPADGLFGSGHWKAFDGILAMYHDQGLIPLKLGGLSGAVNFTAGLPIVRTSPGHGTAYDIAGKGTADHRSTLAAIGAAAAVVAARRRPGGTAR